MSNLPQKSHFLVYQAEGGAIKIDVRFENESVWLIQQLLADPFQATKQNIGQHLQNIFEEGELAQDSAPTHLGGRPRQGGFGYVPTLRPAGHGSCTPGSFPLFQESGGIQAEVPGQDPDVRLTQFTLAGQDAAAKTAIPQQPPQVRLAHAVLVHQ